MHKLSNRRNFVERSAKGIAAVGLLAASSCRNSSSDEFGQLFIHHVFFWLKQPVTQVIRDKFEKALKDLVKVETIVGYHLGLPAPTNRDVIDSSYSYSLLVTFRNKEDQETYQTHPVHLRFIGDCEDLWERVVVYDSVTI
jgi:Stress responsive A/B Barrel Domain